MEKIKAGVVCVTKFCKANENMFNGYINYIDRKSATRTEHVDRYNLYQDYMGNPEKTTDIFTDIKDNLEEQEKMILKTTFQKAQENGSLMWQTVLSFDNRWLEENGLLHKNREELNLDERKLKEITRKSINKMLHNEELDNAVWSGAIHYNTDNIHIHIATVEPIPRRRKKEYTYKKENGETYTQKEYVGKFKEKSIQLCKSTMVNEIIRQRENNLNINNLIRNRFVEEAKFFSFKGNKELQDKFLIIYNNLPRKGNRGLWNYGNNIMKNIRPMIDDLTTTYLKTFYLDEFQLLEKEINKQNDVYMQAYGIGQTTTNEYVQGKMNDLYKRMGNVILKELREYDKSRQEAIPDSLINEPTEPKDEKNIKGKKLSFSQLAYLKDYLEGKSLINKGGNENFRLAIPLLETAALNGDITWAKYSLGKLYFEAPEGIRNEHKGIYWLEQAEKDGNEIASFYLGKKYSNNELNCYNMDQAIFSWEKSANQGNQYAQFKLGKVFLTDDEYKNDTKAMHYLNLACKQGNVYAYHAIGKVQLDKENDYFNPLKGIKNLEIASNMGNKYSSFSLGMVYLKGEYMPKSVEQAKQYLELSKKQGNEIAGKLLKDIDKNSNKKFVSNLKKYFKMEQVRAGYELGKAVNKLKNSMDGVYVSHKNQMEYQMMEEEQERK